MNQNEATNSTVFLNGEQPKQMLTVLAQKAQNLRWRLEEANEAGDGKAFEKLTKELKATEKQMKQVEKSAFDIKKVLDNLSGSSMKDLTKAKKELDKQLGSPTIVRNSKEWKDLQSQLKAVKNEMVSINNESRVTDSGFGKMANGFNKYFAIFTAGLAAITGVTFALKKFMDMRNELEDSKANLQALTGLGDDDVQWLTDQAKLLSTEMSKAGVRIRASSKEIVDAFTIVGSAKPELLKDRDGLKEVTEAALVLATASKMDVVDAAKAITIAMNMYGVSAKEAAKYTNILGAGAKEGAAEVSSQTESILKAGVAASQANIPIEQLVGSIQALAEKGIKDEIAGTGLKSFFIKLQSGADDTNPKIVGLQTALENLANKHMSSAEIQKRFGLETYTVAAAMIDSAKKVDFYTKAVTGTNIAWEQAAINSKTTAAKLAQAKNEFNEAGMELVQSFNPAILKATNLTVLFLHGIIALPKWLKENSGLLLTLAVTMSAYAIAVNRAWIASTTQMVLEKAKLVWTTATTAATLLQVAVTGYLTGATRAANLATKSFFATLALNPFVALGVAIAAITIGLYKWSTANKEISQTVKLQLDIQKKAAEEYDKQAANIDVLVAKIHNENLANADRKKAINDLKAIIPGYNGMLNDEGKLINDNKTAIDQYLISLEKQIKLKAAQDELEQLYRKKRDQEKTLVTAKSESDRIAKETKNADTRYGGGAAIAEVGRSTREALDEANAALNYTVNAIKIVNAEIKNSSGIVSSSVPTTPTLPTGSGSGDTEKEKDKKYKKELAEKEAAFKDEELLNKKYYANESISENTFHVWMYNAKMDFLKEKLELDKKYGKDTTDTETEITDLLISENERWNNELKKEADKLEKETKKANKEDEKETRDHLKRIEEIRNEFGLKNKKVTFREELKALKAKLKAEKATEEETALAIRDMKRKHMEEFFDKAVAVGQRLSSALNNLVESEQMAVDNKYAGQIKAAKKAGEDTTELEEKAAEEKKAITKKYAALNFAITVGTIIAETGAAIMKAAPNVPLQIAEGILGASQLAIAVAQQQSIANLWTGGFTEPGDKYKPAGIVHAGEFVANQDAVRSTPMRKVFNLIDHAQRTNTVARITNEDIARVVGVRKGFSDGGYTSAMQVAGGGSGSGISKEQLAWAIQIAMQENNAVNSALLAELQKGIVAKSVISGNDGTAKKLEEYNKLINNARR